MLEEAILRRLRLVVVGDYGFHHGGQQIEDLSSCGMLVTVTTDELASIFLAVWPVFGLLPNPIVLLPPLLISKIYIKE